MNVCFVFIHLNQAQRGSSNTSNPDPSHKFMAFGKTLRATENQLAEEVTKVSVATHTKTHTQTQTNTSKTEDHHQADGQTDR